MNHQFPHHQADVLAAADRTFRSILRSARAAGLDLPQALRRANEVTVQNTGINMLEQLFDQPIEPDMPERVANNYGIADFLADWKGGRTPVPYTVCRSSAFYDAYVMWCSQNDIAPSHNTKFSRLLHRYEPRMEKIITSIVAPDGGQLSVRIVVPAGARSGFEYGGWMEQVASETNRFYIALTQWKDSV